MDRQNQILLLEGIVDSIKEERYSIAVEKLEALIDRLREERSNELKSKSGIY